MGALRPRINSVMGTTTLTRAITRSGLGDFITLLPDDRWISYELGIWILDQTLVGVTIRN